MSKETQQKKNPENFFGAPFSVWKTKTKLSKTWMRAWMNDENDATLLLLLKKNSLRDTWEY